VNARHQRRFRVAAILIAVAALLLFSGSITATLFPTYNFRKITGRALPREVKVVKFETELCDNLFRSCYYWKLQHPPGAQWTIMKGADFSGGFDWPDGYQNKVLTVLDPEVPRELVTGSYKWSIERSSHFLFVHTNETTSYYYKGTL
jgi:hypothetical protein